MNLLILNTSYEILKKFVILKYLSQYIVITLTQYYCLCHRRLQTFALEGASGGVPKIRSKLANLGGLGHAPRQSFFNDAIFSFLSGLWGGHGPPPLELPMVFVILM